MDEYLFILPTAIFLPRKTMEDKRVALNLNQYHNWQYHMRNQIKQLFVPKEPYHPFKARRVRISYECHSKSNRKYDTMNKVALIDKYFCDWLVKREFIPDDTCEHVSYGTIIGYKGSCDDHVLAFVRVLE